MLNMAGIIKRKVVLENELADIEKQLSVISPEEQSNEYFKIYDILWEKQNRTHVYTLLSLMLSTYQDVNTIQHIEKYLITRKRRNTRRIDVIKTDSENSLVSISDIEIENNEIDLILNGNEEDYQVTILKTSEISMIVESIKKDSALTNDTKEQLVKNVETNYQQNITFKF